MSKRVKFKCWQCEQEYSLLRDLGQAKLLVECPFCGAEGEVDLAPWRSPVMTTHKGENAGEQPLAEILHLPEVLPTRPIQETTGAAAQHDE